MKITYKMVKPMNLKTLKLLIKTSFFNKINDFPAYQRPMYTNFTLFDVAL